MQAIKFPPQTVRRAKTLVAARPQRSAAAATSAQPGDNALLLLQRTIGNQAVQHLLRQPAKHSGPVGAQGGSPLGLSNGAVAAPQSPLYVSFINELPPAAPDHSQANPGPGGTTADRAGYSRATIKKRMVITWNTGRTSPDGRVPLFARSVNVYFQLVNLQLSVSSDYAKGSCPYEVTLAHERTHIAAFSRYFSRRARPLVRDLEAVSVPTAAAPTLVDPAADDAEQESVAARLSAVIKQHSADIKATQDADRAAKDSPAAYAAIHARCPAAEW